jgi:ABC-type multidrug transport system ATPase subunit
MLAPLIHLADVSWRSGSRHVLSGLSIAVQRGEALGVVGPNGSGKTTLLRLMVGLIQPSGGAVALAGQSVRRGLGLCRVSYFGGWSTLPPAMTTSSWYALAGVQARPAGPDCRLGRLSPGLRQQAGLHASVDREAVDLIVLDEPWESLDVHASRWLSARLRRHRNSGVTLVVTSHRMPELLGVCSRIAFLSNGVLHEASPADWPTMTVDQLFDVYDRVVAG